jgi:hypothetical protein
MLEVCVGDNMSKTVQVSYSKVFEFEFEHSDFCIRKLVFIG